MHWYWIVAIAIGAVIVLLAAWRLTFRAGRLDRLHRRMDAAWVSLDQALNQRVEIAERVAQAELPDPASASAIKDSLELERTVADSDFDTRCIAESRVTRELADAFADEGCVADVNDRLGSTGLMDELNSVTRRVEMTRRFYNDAVRATVAVREQRMAALARLRELRTDRERLTI